MKLEFTDKALDRLTDIYDFISRGSSNRAAVEIHNTILDEIATLSVFPEMASIEPLLDEEPQVFRSLVVRRRYKVILLYRVRHTENCRYLGLSPKSENIETSHAQTGKKIML